MLLTLGDVGGNDYKEDTTNDDITQEVRQVLGTYPKPRGYSFSPESVGKDENGYIKAVVSYVPNSKVHFMNIFGLDRFQESDFNPHCEEYDLYIDTKKNIYCKHLFVYRDEKGKVIEVGHEGATEWKHILSDSTIGRFRKLIFSVLEYYHGKFRQFEYITDRYIDCGGYGWNCAQVSKRSLESKFNLLECYNEEKGHWTIGVYNKEELIEKLCGK